MRFAVRIRTLRTAAAALTCIAILRAEAGFEQGFLDRSAVLETAARANTNNFPDAREVLVAGALRVEANADATYTQWQEEYVAILTEQAREQRRTVSSHFTIPYQRGTQDCAVTLVEIIRPGSVIPVDVSMNSRVMVDPSSMSANIYNPNDKLLQVSIPGLEIGDILHTVFFDRVVQPRMRGTWSEWVPMEDTRPIMFQSVRFSLPEETPLRSIALKAPVAGTVTGRQSRADGRLIYEWEARDVPRMFPEPNMPPVHTVAQRLLVSTAPDWQTVSRWYWELSAPHLAPSPELTAKSRELVEGATSRRDRIERVFRFVSQEIRYMGITVETTAPGYEPHDVKDTFAARHGVCRDKAALLVAMLREAGIEAFPTLIHTGALKDQEVPQPYFNHAIVAAREPDGSYLLMDPTDENTRDLLPAYLGHRSYLVATPEGETLRTSPVEPAERNMVHVETIASLDAGGRLEAKTLLSFGGVNDGIYRGWFARSRPEDRRRAVEGWAKSAAPGARVLDLRFQPAELTDTTVPLTVRFSYEAPDFAIPGRETRVLPVPSLGTSIGMVNFIVGNTGLKERKYPLTTDIACGVSEKIRLSPGAAAGRALDLPAAVSREDDDLSWRRSFSMTNGTLVANSDFRLHSVEFAPSAYGKLKDVLAGIENASRALPVYAKPTEDREPADSIIESSSVVFDVRGRGEWTETRTFRKRVLSYAGRKSNSELKLNFNEAWEDVRIVSAVVTAPDGTCVSISTNEINLMDQPWVGAAPRYPHGRTLVAAFPAVQAGSVIECTFVRECRDRPFFAARETFAGPDPINAKSVFLTGLASGSVAAAVRDGEPGRGAAWAAVTASNGAWRTVNSPAVRNEEALPPWWSFTPSLTLSAGDWKLYSAEVNRRLVAAASARKSAAYAARGLVRGTRDPIERIRLIRDFVATRIRRAGPDLTSLPLSAITPADRTLADGYGNSADRAVLLYAMLESAGLEPGFVLASGYPATTFFEERLAAPVADDFGTVLVRVDVPSRGTQGAIYLNDTDQYAPLGASAHAANLGIDPATGTFIEIAPLLAERASRFIQVRLDAAGDALLTVRTELHGMHFAAERRRYAEMTPEERRRHHLELIGALSQAGEADGPLKTDFESYPGMIEFSARLPRYAAVSGPYMHVPLHATLRDLIGLRSASRVNPVYFANRALVGIGIEIAPPAGFSVESLPPETDFMPCGPVPFDVRCAASDGDGTISVTFTAEMEPCIVPARAYGALLELDRQLSHPGAGRIMLRKNNAE